MLNLILASACLIGGFKCFIKEDWGLGSALALGGVLNLFLAIPVAA